MDELTLCELWDLTRPALLPHSRLYSLEPIGMGTAAMESLTGYVARLAETHCVRTRAVVVREVQPLLNKAHVPQPAHSSIPIIWWHSAHSMNGTGSLAMNWVQALETLTGRRDLRFLTLLTWADVLPWQGLLRSTRAWCPACYEAWRQAGQVIYEPLLWALQVITVCPHHHCRLQLQCPHPECQAKTQFLLAAQSRPGHCSRCGGWLGIGSEADALLSEALSEKELAWQTWVSNAVGELLAHTPDPSIPPPPYAQSLAEAVKVCVERVAQGKVRTFVREWHLDRLAVKGWMKAERLPTLRNLLQFCYRLGTPPLILLTQSIAAVDWSKVRRLESVEPCSAPKRARRPFDAEGVRRALEAELASDAQPPPPMCEVARRLGHHHADLHTRFPDLCRAISARYLNYCQQRRKQRTQRLCEEVRQTVIKLHARGVYPSSWRIRSLLSVPDFMRDSEAIATWHATLRELGWES